MTLAALCFGTAASAATVTVSETLEITTAGEDLLYEFDSLGPSDGSGGTVTIVGSGLNTFFSPGPDLAANFEADTVDISLDGDFQGTYSCDGNSGSQTFDTSVVTTIAGLAIGCTFTQTFTLTGAELDALIADGSFDVLFATSADVQPRNNSPITVTLSYMAAVPLPASLPLGLAGVGLLLGLSRRRR